MLCVGDSAHTAKQAWVDSKGPRLLAVLQFVVHNGGKIRETGSNVFTSHDRAGSTVALCFGRAELEVNTDDDRGDSSRIAVGAVPQFVIVQIVQRLVACSKGKSAQSMANQLYCVREMGMSDGNLKGLLDANILDAVVAILTTTATIQKGWQFQVARYNIKAAREGLLDFLLMLTLNASTCAQVRTHPEIAAAVQFAYVDSDVRLSNAAHRKLHGVRMNLGLANSVKAGALPQSTQQQHGHLMLSYCWANQPVIKRIHTALVARGYDVWIDIEQMQGSTVDAMADAIDNAAAVLYGVSDPYKVSANCRLEASYAHTQKKIMIPIMLQDGYEPKGWLGMFLGTKLWYGFFGSTLDSDAAFHTQVDAVCKEFKSEVLRRNATLSLADTRATLGLADTRTAAALQSAALPEPSPLPTSSRHTAHNATTCTSLPTSQPTPALSATSSPHKFSTRNRKRRLAEKPGKPGVSSRLASSTANVQVAQPSSLNGSSSAAVIAWANQLGLRIEAINEKGLFDSGAGAGGRDSAEDAIASGASGIPPVLTAARDFMADCVAIAAIADSITSDEALAVQIKRMFARSSGYGGK